MILKNIKYFLVGLVLLSAVSIFPCGPFFEETIFSFLYTQSDKRAYLLGKPIFIKPSFFRRDLTFAYRYLMGGKRINAATNNYPEMDSIPVNNLPSWSTIRNKALGLPPNKEIEIKTYKYTQRGGYNSYENCYADAFQFAAQTLSKRIEQYGVKSKEVITWVTGQDIVFSNCGGDALNIPSNINYPKDHILIKDREYQVAAAYFYAGEFDHAKSLFQKIADDQDSPYNKISAYLVARNLVRKAFLSKEEGFVKENLEEALSISNSLLTKPEFKELKNALTNQIRRIQFYIKPNELTKELETLILTSSTVPDLARNDFARLLETNSEEAKADSSMADWILNFRTEEKKASLDYALKKWKDTKSTPWFVSVITKISPDHTDVKLILDEGRNYKKDNYAYLTVSYHRIRLLLEQGRILAAQNLLAEVLADPQLNTSDKNLFLNFRPYLVNSEKEFIESAHLKPIGHSYDDDSNELFEDKFDKTKVAPHFTKAFAQIWNQRIPIDKMVKIYSKEKVPTHLEKNFLFALFAKAILLNRIDIMTALIPGLSLHPELRKELALFQKANTKEEKEFAGILTLLRLPGIKPNVQFGYFRSNISQIDDYRDNWWCAFSELKEEDNVLFPRHPIFKYTRLKFISEQEDKQAKLEWETLTRQGTAPDYLSSRVIEFSKTLPNNPDLPEALHLVVKTTRFGCTGDKTSEYSKNAFRILHKKFPKSEWANKTQFHF